MHCCCVPGCSHPTLAVKLGIPFHNFPKDPEIRRRWLVNIRNQNFPVNTTAQKLKNYHVCGKHFKPSDYVCETKHLVAPHLFKKRNILKKTAVPTQFSFEECQTCKGKPKPTSATSRPTCTVTKCSYESSPQIQYVRSAYLKREKLRKCTEEKAVVEPEQSKPLPLPPVSKLPSNPPTSSPFSSPVVNHSSPLWQPTLETSSDSEFVESEREIFSDATEQSKVIVFENSLMELFKRCQLCGEGIIRAIPLYKGAQIVVGWECVMGHSGSWYGGPEVRRMPLVNLILSAGILFSGNTFSGISRYAASVDLKFFKPSTYNTLQNTYLLPVVDRVYTRQQNGILAEMILKSLDGISVSLIGDGRSDLPGYSAKYTTYT